jgi:hypothetical protein
MWLHSVVPNPDTNSPSAKLTSSDLSESAQPTLLFAQGERARTHEIGNSFRQVATPSDTITTAIATTVTTTISPMEQFQLLPSHAADML